MSLCTPEWWSHVVTVVYNFELCLGSQTILNGLHIFWLYLLLCSPLIWTVLSGGNNISYLGTNFHWEQYYNTVHTHIYLLNVTIWVTCLYLSWNNTMQGFNFAVIQIYCWRLIRWYCWTVIEKGFTTVACCVYVCVCMCTWDVYLTAMLIHLPV